MLTQHMSEQSAYYLYLEEKFGAHNYHPIPVVIEKGSGIFYGMLMANDIMIF